MSDVRYSALIGADCRRLQADSVAIHPAMRKPKRITITLSESIYDQLVERSNQQGRSLSNLAAYLLEHSL